MVSFMGKIKEHEGSNLDSGNKVVAAREAVGKQGACAWGTQRPEG